MARAKRTQRTDARKRYRAEQAGPAETGASATAAGTTASKAAPGQPAKSGQQRPGFTTLMRSAYRSPNILEDLRALPVVLLNPGFLIAMAASAAIAVWFCLAYNGPVSQVPANDTEGLSAVLSSYSIPYMLMGMVFSPPPAVGAFLIGFMAKRASWLGGLIYGIFCVIVVILVLQQPAGRMYTVNQTAEQWIIQNAALAPVGAALFAAAAAWYKRFLALSSPNRNAAREQQKKQPKPQGRGDVRPNHKSRSAD